jgi:hypothetical protein
MGLALMKLNGLRTAKTKLEKKEKKRKDFNRADPRWGRHSQPYT